MPQLTTFVGVACVPVRAQARCHLPCYATETTASHCCPSGLLPGLLLPCAATLRCCQHTAQPTAASAAVNTAMIVLYHPMPIVGRARGLSCSKAAGQTFVPCTGVGHDQVSSIEHATPAMQTLQVCGDHSYVAVATCTKPFLTCNTPPLRCACCSRHVQGSKCMGPPPCGSTLQ